MQNAGVLIFVGGNWSTRRKVCPSVNLSIPNPTRAAVGGNTAPPTPHLDTESYQFELWHGPVTLSHALPCRFDDLWSYNLQALRCHPSISTVVQHLLVSQTFSVWQPGIRVPYDLCHCTGQYNTDRNVHTAIYMARFEFEITAVDTPPPQTHT
jgi:hypothetical protein